MKKDDILKQAYGNIIKEPVLDWFADLRPDRPIRYYWIKFKRFFTRRR